MTFILSKEEYEALISFARRGAAAPEEKRALDSFLAGIEKANDVTRYKLWVQWQEADTTLPSAARFPDKWPPELRYYIELVSRPIARVDVDEVLRLHARSPVTVLVTPDPAAIIGWTKVDDFFRQ